MTNETTEAVANDYIQSSTDITKITLPELQNAIEARNLLLEQEENNLLKYPYEQKTNSGQSKIRYML